MTELVHGCKLVPLQPAASEKALIIDDALQQTLGSSQLLYRVPPQQLTAQQVLSQLSHEPFFHRVKWSDIKGVPITKLMVAYGLCKSRAEASRMVSSKAVSVNGKVLTDPRDEVKMGELVDGCLAVVKMGKKGHLVFYADTAASAEAA